MHPSETDKENEIVDGNQMNSLNSSYLGETDIEKEKIVKDEQNRSRQNYDHLLQSKFKKKIKKCKNISVHLTGITLSQNILCHVIINQQ